ncbi:MAG: DUF951 domain-containing protein [Eubacteriales bacterium]|jgi:hypothetical protein|nr:DUF951 domain-containing protein [Eubacteriales bacterium]MDD3197462.1 DUF951 domain-containing protein [Eubacteriales bacterium]MDD3503974.1 DUF951 domain-containing protein [Eubacteriales bacterium]MDD4682565.1 DUF951 domain-containing protein [Eubacteriales bacterium]
MASKYELYQFKPGERLRLKKQHPCGGYDWEVVRIGADITIKCLNCGRQMNMPRRQLEKAVKAILE